MGRSRTGRLVAAALGAVVCVLAPASASWADQSGPTPGSSAPPASSTTLPPIPSVPAAVTAGQPVAKLLESALSLSSLGVDDSSLVGAVALTQRHIDTDAARARRAEAAAARSETAADAARTAAEQATASLQRMQAALRQAVVDLYVSGPDSMSARPSPVSLFAEDYAESALDPYGVVARARSVELERKEASQAQQQAARRAARASAEAQRALSDQRAEVTRLQAELASISRASAQAVLRDHSTLAAEAAAELVGSGNGLEWTPKQPVPAPVATTAVALTWAFAELGKPYVWGATGPNTFDCSGLTQFVWKAAGVPIPRVAADQDAWAVPVPLSQLLPGDLVFFGTTDIHHVGIYIGDGLMINAPHTGDVVRVSSIWWSDLAGFGRVHHRGVPVPPHNTPQPGAPIVRAVVAAAGPVPSQVTPPPGWTPKPGETTPIRVTHQPGRHPASTAAPTSAASGPTTTTVPAGVSGPPGPVTSTTSTTTAIAQPILSTTTSAPPAG